MGAIFAHYWSEQCTGLEGWCAWTVFLKRSFWCTACVLSLTCTWIHCIHAIRRDSTMTLRRYTSKHACLSLYAAVTDQSVARPHYSSTTGLYSSVPGIKDMC